MAFAKNAMVRRTGATWQHWGTVLPSSNTVLPTLHKGSNVFYYLGAPRFTSVTSAPTS